MNKFPWMQFMVADWLHDTGVLSAATRGIWIDACATMHAANQSGELRGTIEQLARILRCSTSEMEMAAMELDQTGVADVKRESNGFGNAIVTLINRRMKRAYNEREASRLRVTKHRGNGKRNGDVMAPVTQNNQPRNGNVTPLESESESESEGETRVREVGNASKSAAESREKSEPNPPLVSEAGNELTVSERITREKELTRVEAELTTLKVRVTGGWSLSAGEKLRRAELRERTVELLAILGMKA